MTRLLTSVYTLFDRLRADPEAAPNRLRRWRRLHDGPERDITLDSKHGRMTFSSKDSIISKGLFIAREYGYADLDRAMKLLRAERLLPEAHKGYVLDIGANIGTVCIPLILEDHFKGALAFEPAPRNFSYLQRNISQNNLGGRITAFQVALSTHDGTLEMELCDDNFGDHRLRLAGPHTSGLYEEDKRPVVQVPVRTLDGMVRTHGLAYGDIKLVYMDVQGHELHVLQGGAKVLATGVPVVMEIWPYGFRRAGVDWLAVSQFVTAHFSHLYDLRSEQPPRRPADAIRDIFLSLGNEGVTDVLLVP